MHHLASKEPREDRRLLHTSSLRPPPQPTGPHCRPPHRCLGLTCPPTVIVTDPPEWVPDEACGFCTACKAPFTVIRRKHHCRSCGKVGGWAAGAVPQPPGLPPQTSQGASADPVPRSRGQDQCPGAGEDLGVPCRETPVSPGPFSDLAQGWPWASRVALAVKNPPANAGGMETGV